MGSIGWHCAVSRDSSIRRSVLVCSALLGISSLVSAGCGSDSPAEEPLPATGTTSTPKAGSSSPGGAAMVDAGTATGSGGRAASGSSGTMSVGTGASGSNASAAAGMSGGGAKAGAGGMSLVDAGMSMSDMDAGPAMSGDEDAGCMPPETPLDVSRFPKCSAEICPAQDSVCFPISTLRAIASQETIDVLANCEAENTKCVPIELASAAGRSLLTKCKSINGVEGRCTSTCVPQVAQQMSLLPKDVCTGSNLCAPCYDPRTGEDTLACRQGCDPGPTEGPKTFDKCCGDRGLCVPPELAAAQAKNLDQDTCGTGTLCAPTELTDPTFKATTCDSIDGAEGRCISTCVGGAVAKQRDRLPTAGCGTDELCAPCYDPITGEDTGACTVNGDKPAKPAQTFARCCGESNGQPVGVCVSPELAGGQAMALRQEMCAEGKLCAPIAKASDPAFEFQTCSSILGEGVCVNACIPDQAQAALLSRGGCAQGELCAPCNLLGSPTGACL
jgi:hypothetical protein